MAEKTTKDAGELVLDAPAATSLYVVREGFVLHPRDGGEPKFGGETVELTDADAVFHAVVIEPVE